MKLNLRLVLVVAAVPGVAIVLYLQFQKLLADRSVLPPDDFVEYWAAGWLNAIGENPYDPEKLLPLERSAGRDTDEAIMMWNPPWTLAIAMPFGVMDSRAAQLLWLILGFIFIAAGADLLWRVYDGPPQMRWVAWLLAFTFLPTFFVLGSGQIGPWVLLGAVLFLVFLRQGWPMLAGAATVLLAIKPHLVYLFWIALIVWGVRRNWRMLIGGLIAGVTATALAVACNPDVLHQYWEAMTQRPPAQWQSPTLGTVLRMIEGESRFGLQFVPGLLGVGWLIWHFCRGPAAQAREAADPLLARRSQEWRWPEQLPMLLLVSFVTASYGAWPFDLVILLPAVIQVAAKIARHPSRSRVGTGLVCWLVINVPALLLNVLKVNSFWFIWVAPVMLIAYLLTFRTMDDA